MAKIVHCNMLQYVYIKLHEVKIKTSVMVVYFKNVPIVAQGTITRQFINNNASMNGRFS